MLTENSTSTLTSTIIRSVYGFNIQDANDPYISNAEQLMAGLAAAGIPGKFLVDTLPFCESSRFVVVPNVNAASVKYVPSWVPGAGFQRQAKAWKDLLPYFVDEPFDYVVANVVNMSSSL